MVGSEGSSVKKRRRHEIPQGGFEDEFARASIAESELKHRAWSHATKPFWPGSPSAIARILEAVIEVFAPKAFDGWGVAEIANRKIIASEVKPPSGAISSRRRASPRPSSAIPRAPASRKIGLLMPGDDPRGNLAIYVPGHRVGAIAELTLRRLGDSFERK